MHMPTTLKVGYLDDDLPEEVAHEALGYLLDANSFVEEAHDDLLALEADPEATPQAIADATAVLEQSIRDLMEAKNDVAGFGIEIHYDA